MKPVLSLSAAMIRQAQFAEGDDAEDPQFSEALEALVVQAEALSAATGDERAALLAALLADLDSDALQTLLDGLREGFNAAAANVQSDADVDALERVANAVTVVEDAQTEIDGAATARADRVASLAATVNGEGDGTGEGEGDGEPTGEGEGDEGDTAPEGEGEGEGEGETPEPTAAEIEEQRIAASAASRGAGAGRPARRPASLAGLTRTTPPQHRTAPEGEGAPGGESIAGAIINGQDYSPMLRLVASAELAIVDPSLRAEKPVGSMDKLGLAISRMSTRMKRRNPRDSDDPESRHYIGSMEFTPGPRSRIIAADGLIDSVGVDGVLDRATDRILELRREAAAMAQTDEGRRIVASGGTCAPAEPDYTLTLIGDAGTDFVDKQPTVGGIRPLRYFPWFEVDMTSATNRRNQFGHANGDNANARPDPFAAAGHVTAAQDAAGYVGSTPAGPTANKSCLHITCADPVDIDLEASYMCTTVGNFQSRSFPEFVTMWDDYTKIGFDHARDAQAQAKVLAHANAKTVTGSVDFGLDVALLSSIRKLATRIRSVRRARNLPIDVWVEEWIGEAAADSIARTMFPGGIDGLRITGTEALAILAVTENIYVNTYRAPFGSVDGRVTGVLAKQAAGAELDWPASTRIGVWPTGTVFQKTGWEIQFGLQEVGMETNDVSTFMELAENTGIRGSDIYFIDKPVCVSGVRAGGLVLDCTDED